MTQLTKNKIVNKLTGRKLSEETKNKMRLAKLGKSLSMAHRRAIAENSIRTPEWNAAIGKSVSKTKRLQRPRVYLTGPVVFDKPKKKIRIITIPALSPETKVYVQPLIRDNYKDRFNIPKEPIPVIEKDYIEEAMEALALL